MKHLEAWFAKTVRRTEKQPSLYDALLGIRPRAYVWYRLRFISIRAMLRFVLHLAEMLILVRLFLPELLAPVLFIRSWMAFATGTWWGGLEQMRETVRRHAEQRQWALVRQTIDGWMGLAFLLALFGIAGGVGLRLLLWPEPAHFTFFDAYLLACLLRTACDIVGRTWHSGIFALRRIYRPLWSLLVVDVLDVGLALALWPWLGPWGFAVALLVTGIVRLGVLVAFVNRGLAQTRVPRVRWPQAATAIWRRFSWRGVWGWLRHALANAVLQLDSLVTMGLAAAVYFSSGDELVAIVFYIVRPVFHAGHAWSRLFYFDYSLLKRRFAVFFLHRYDVLLRQTALWFSLVAASVCVVLSWWLLGGDELRFPLLLGALALMRSFLGLLQIRAFALHAHKPLWLSGFFVIVAALVLPNAVQDVYGLFFGLLLVMAIAAVWLYLRRDITPVAPVSKGSPLHPVAFVHALQSMEQPLELFCAEFSVAHFPLRRIITALKQAVPERIFCPLDRRTLLWFQPATDVPATHDVVATQSAGTLMRIRCHMRSTEPAPMLRVILEELGRVTPHLAAQWQVAPSGLALLLSEFHAQFPGGQALTAEGGALGAVASRTVARELRALLSHNAHNAHRIQLKLPIARSTLVIFAPNDQLQCLFVIPRTNDNAEAQQVFAARVLTTSLRETLGTTLRDIVVSVSQIDA